MARKTRDTRHAAPETLPTKATAVCATDDPPTPIAQAARLADQAFKANLARLTAGVSPAGLARVYFDWLSHLVQSPGKQVELAEKVARKIARFSRYASQKAVDNGTPPCIDPLPQDRRFANEA